MFNIKPRIITLLQIFTVFIINTLILYRFRIRFPTDIFINPNMYNLYIYIFILIINIIMLFVLLVQYKQYKFKKSRVKNIILKLRTWYDNSYDKVFTIIAEFPGIFSIALAYMTYYYVLIPLSILKFVMYIPRITLCLAISYDVFYLEKFYYSYIVIYLLLLTLISKAILYISIEIDNRIILEAKESIIMVDPEKTIRESYEMPQAPFNIEDYTLGDFNKQFTSIEDAFHIFTITRLELNTLEIIKNKIETPLLFTIALRVFYIIIFGYIVLKYFIYYF